ncbi:hypothetical protein AT248_08015 [Bartonella henselae]|nr:hypothetical protein AT242_07995 [Bartonella henselae]PNM38868.1 hypothetical protein AL470_005890 [Bartonella henselae str. Houston-1]OLL47860.1 hypothetical protein AT247_08010 [Bartonella henselae]OLL50012.1 hypothetical protein AT241_07925 [Bartonella henselae]OLL54127.1 hypothetical protein AT239_07750 [Bartonella henselae]
MKKSAKISKKTNFRKPSFTNYRAETSKPYKEGYCKSTREFPHSKAPGIKSGAYRIMITKILRKFTH